jgi:hypothetical protein
MSPTSTKEWEPVYRQLATACRPRSDAGIEAKQGKRKHPGKNRGVTYAATHAETMFRHIAKVPEVGLEPTHLSILHFECSASANSAIRAGPAA